MTMKDVIDVAQSRIKSSYYTHLLNNLALSQIVSYSAVSHDYDTILFARE